MNPHRTEDARLWRRLLQQLPAELECLTEKERAWLAGRLEAIAAAQTQLHQAVAAAEGEALCCRCAGECCAHGRHHVALVNLLQYLLPGQQPPVPDFGRSCPFLGEHGCLFDPPRRPLGCVIFICEALDERLDRPTRERLAALERELRRIYDQLAEHYVGSTLRGLLQRAARLDGTPLLAPPPGRS